jgi:hypothetical protein
VRDACVDEGADAVWDGDEPGRGCLWLALAVGSDGLSRDKKQRGGERAGILAFLAHPTEEPKATGQVVGAGHLWPISAGR